MREAGDAQMKFLLDEIISSIPRNTSRVNSPYWKSKRKNRKGRGKEN